MDGLAQPEGHLYLRDAGEARVLQKGILLFAKQEERNDKHIGDTLTQDGFVKGRVTKVPEPGNAAAEHSTVTDLH